MKKLSLLFMLGLLWTACSENKMDIESSDVPSESSFLKLRVVSTSNIGTRSADEEYDDKETGPSYGDYKDGTDKENEVSSVLFLFFDDNGNPASVTRKDDGSGDFLNYILVEDAAGSGQDHGLTVEKIIEKTITVQVPQRQAKPTKVFTVLNPPATLRDSLKTMTLDQIRTTYRNFYTNINESNDSGDEFVMTNSVYYETVGDTKKVVDYTPLTEADYYPLDTEETSMKPVIIFVERILARIDLSIGSGLTGIIPEGKDYYIYKTGKTFPEELKSQIEDEKGYEIDNDIYVRFLGWNVFDTANKSRLVKKINTEWDNTTIFGLEEALLPWNVAAYHRSYWAINPPAGSFGYWNGPFHKDNIYDDLDENLSWTADHNPMPSGDTKYVTAYFQENAAPEANVNDAPVNPTKVIIAAQLVDSAGNAMDLAQWGGDSFSVDGLKAHFANLLNLWFISSVEVGASTPTKETYTRITPDYLVFKQSGSDKYTVSLSIDEDKIKADFEECKNNGIRWFSHDSEKEEFSPVTDTRAAIESVVGSGTIKIWTKGYTYYYFNIRHLGVSENEDDAPSAYYGIVRNHIYEANIRSIYGIGTPVFDPETDITITTDPDQSKLIAKVEILSWRIVHQEYDLTW